jgi:hypothetical protein
MFSSWFKSNPSIPYTSPPIQQPRIKTVYDLNCDELVRAIENMDSQINKISLASRLKSIWIDDAARGLNRDRNASQIKGGKRKTRKIRHRFTQNRK